MASEERVANYRKRLEDLGVFTEERVCRPKTVTPEWLLSYMTPNPHPWSPALCAAIVHHLEARHLLSKGGRLTFDPRGTQSEWHGALAAAGADARIAMAPHDVEALRELLNIAWGAHEMTAEHVGDVAVFFAGRAAVAHHKLVS